MGFMDAPSLTPERSRELADLRRRAYGPDADIQRDPGALHRLHELEALAREEPAAAEAPAPATQSSDSKPATASATAEPRASGLGEQSAPATTKQPAADGEGVGSAPPTLPRRRWWRRIPV